MGYVPSGRQGVVERVVELLVEAASRFQ